jgi:hypothetical protein
LCHECVQILCCAISARKAAIQKIFKNHSWVMFCCRRKLYMHWKYDSQFCLFSSFRVRLLDDTLRFRNCGARKPSVGQFGHIQTKAYVGLFQLYPTSLPCHSRRHVEKPRRIQLRSPNIRFGITSTMYTSITTTKDIKHSFTHSWRQSSRS